MLILEVNLALKEKFVCILYRSRGFKLKIYDLKLTTVVVGIITLYNLFLFRHSGHNNIMVLADCHY